MENILALDLVRGVHLLCIAVGMGPAFYYDIRTMQRITQPLSRADISELHRIHQVISVACVGLWVSGMALIWARTGFVLSEFSPKLWTKVGVVTVLTVNAVVLSSVMIPALSAHVGMRLVDLPRKTLLPMTLCAGVSLTCWLLALALGSSVTLKTADWGTLSFVLIEATALCIGGVVMVMFGLRAFLRREEPLGGLFEWEARQRSR